jgi:hypothetical protein
MPSRRWQESAKIATYALVSELVYESHLKCDARKGLRVRVPPRALSGIGCNGASASRYFTVASDCTFTLFSKTPIPVASMRTTSPSFSHGYFAGVISLPVF